MKAKAELNGIISQIASDASPVGMDAVYVHALILDKLSEIERRLTELEETLVNRLADNPQQSNDSSCS